jgi:hypothetical protein
MRTSSRAISNRAPRRDLLSTCHWYCRRRDSVNARDRPLFWRRDLLRDASGASKLLQLALALSLQPAGHFGRVVTGATDTGDCRNGGKMSEQSGVWMGGRAAPAVSKRGAVVSRWLGPLVSSKSGWLVLTCWLLANQVRLSLVSRPRVSEDQNKHTLKRAFPSLEERPSSQVTPIQECAFASGKANYSTKQESSIK